MAEGYAIICDARRGQDLGIDILALVDRKLTNALWWTSDDSDLILNFKKRSTADHVIGSLKRNNPRVVSYAEAVKRIQEQWESIGEDEAARETEAGWDGHKDV